MAERLKAIDCKSIGISYVGSNPTFSKTEGVLHRTRV